MDDPTTTEGQPHGSRGLRRKTVLRAALAAGVAAPAVGAALTGLPALARTVGAAGGTPTLTPECDDGDDPTPPQTEGPYFKPNSPRRASLVQSRTPGTRLTVTGYVFGLACLPIGDVLLGFWQADHAGAYDNVGFRFRGHQFTGADGGYRLVTIVPGLYPGRTRHIHVKVQAPGRRVLTTQLYFPGEPRNNTDAIFDPRLLMTVRDTPTGREATFDFVLDVPQQPGPQVVAPGLPAPRTRRATESPTVGAATSASRRT
ncbi:Protocatechuate 3,4-dioxygenase beta subunit [Amycolatopsis arida]|uniref:Protocatechuate 3,4-dioxygenase beta subunit n=1 Tax=Amycolatopsis arida TaxID=587909 RepID=A0A1I5KZQ1_9PSEU|nr:protocatechuate 3,4-dioxygenase beta subunit [Amycolatopsis arida]SFO90515.1 Protocatechuate 3,4-dioxygenase beta subunit [Amycolatopsis arida]